MSSKTPTDHARGSMTPSPRALFARTFLPFQLWHFVWINWRMIRMIALSHPRRRAPSPR